MAVAMALAMAMALALAMAMALAMDLSLCLAMALALALAMAMAVAMAVAMALEMDLGEGLLIMKRFSVDYWLVCVEEAFEDAGIKATRAQINTVARYVEGGHENYRMSPHGYDLLPSSKPSQVELDIYKIRKRAIDMNDYTPHTNVNCIGAYKEPKNKDAWLTCPKCALKPLIWEYDNGRETACGCWETKYDRFSVSSESIMSYIKRKDGSVTGYDWDGLMKNWNHYCKTGEELFKPGDGKW